MIFCIFYFFQLFNLGRTELVCNFGENCDSFCEAEICEYNWEVNYKYSNVWTTMDYQFGNEGFIRGFPLFFNETSDRLEIPKLDTGLYQGRVVKKTC